MSRLIALKTVDIKGVSGLSCKVLAGAGDDPIFFTFSNSNRKSQGHPHTRGEH